MRGTSRGHHDAPSNPSDGSSAIAGERSSGGGEVWRFGVANQRAESVYLVQESAEGVSSWLPMNPVSQGKWELCHPVGQGHYRFRYYTAEGSLFINCGSAGLNAKRVSAPDPAVIIEPLDAISYAATA